LEFADYRPYTPGDDLRLVDWNVWARLEMVLVRLFHEDRNMAVGITVDATGSMGFGQPRKCDHAAELAACLAVCALLVRDSVTIGCSGGVGPGVRVKGHNTKVFGSILKLLERIEPGGATDPVRAMRVQLQGAKQDRFFLLSDMLHEDREREGVLRLLAASSRRPVLLHTLSQQELEPDLSEPSKIVDVESGESFVIDGGRAAADKYNKALGEWIGGLRERCRELGVQYIPAWTTVPVRELMQRRLRRNRVVESIRGGGR